MCAGLRPDASAAQYLMSPTAGLPMRRSVVIELLVFGVLAFAAMLVVGVLVGVLGLLAGIVTLPFRILGWTIKLLGLAFALPLLLVPAVIIGTLLLVVLGVTLLPMLPFVALIYIVYRLVRGRSHDRPSHASVVS